MDFLLHFGPSHYNDLFRCEEPFFSGRGKGDVAAFVEKYKENYEKAQRKGLICIPSGNHDMDRLAIYDQCSDRIGYDQCQRNHKDHTALDLFSHTLFHIITYSYGIRLPGPSQSVHLHLRASVLRF